MRTWKGGVRTTIISHITPSSLSLLTLVCGVAVTPDLLCKTKKENGEQYAPVWDCLLLKGFIVVSEETLAGIESALGNAWCSIFVWSLGHLLPTGWRWKGRKVLHVMLTQ